MFTTTTNNMTYYGSPAPRNNSYRAATTTIHRGQAKSNRQGGAAVTRAAAVVLSSPPPIFATTHHHQSSSNSDLEDFFEKTATATTTTKAKKVPPQTSLSRTSAHQPPPPPPSQPQKTTNNYNFNDSNNKVSIWRNNGGTTTTSSDSDSDSDEIIDLDVPTAVRRRCFMPLPGIAPRSEGVTYKLNHTMSLNNNSNNAKSMLNVSPNKNSNFNLTEFSSNGGGGEDYFRYLNNRSSMNTNTGRLVHADSCLGIYCTPSLFGQRREVNTRYHFGLAKRLAHRLPSLDSNNKNHSLRNAMDLDEDLPMIHTTLQSVTVANEPVGFNQRQIYTSPGDRMVSPVKRPQAPSPPLSINRNSNNNKFRHQESSDLDDSDYTTIDDDSIFSKN